MQLDGARGGRGLVGANNTMQPHGLVFANESWGGSHLGSGELYGVGNSRLRCWGHLISCRRGRCGVGAYLVPAHPYPFCLFFLYFTPPSILLSPSCNAPGGAGHWPCVFVLSCGWGMSKTTVCKPRLAEFQTPIVFDRVCSFNCSTFYRPFKIVKIIICILCMHYNAYIILFWEILIHEFDYVIILFQSYSRLIVFGVMEVVIPCNINCLIAPFTVPLKSQIYLCTLSKWLLTYLDFLLWAITIIVSRYTIILFQSFKISFYIPLHNNYPTISIIACVPKTLCRENDSLIN